MTNVIMVQDNDCSDYDFPIIAPSHLDIHTARRMVESAITAIKANKPNDFDHSDLSIALEPLGFEFPYFVPSQVTF